MVPLAGFAQQVLHRHLAIGEDQRTGGRAADAELVLLRADGKARRVALDEKGGELLAVDLGKTVKRSANPLLEIHIFSPLST